MNSRNFKIIYLCIVGVPHAKWLTKRDCGEKRQKNIVEEVGNMGIILYLCIH